ncbi:hypothetical protein, partial [Streptomyces flavofungini]|uniref:hypothetical protein n=1 Tax=Streptomyces flavofungini TaxID=68200 RepID=UPI0034DF2B9A
MSSPIMSCSAASCGRVADAVVLVLRDRVWHAERGVGPLLGEPFREALAPVLLLCGGAGTRRAEG